MNQQIPDGSYSKTIINCCLLRTQEKNISWEISDFNKDNDQTFDINLFNAFQQIIKDRVEVLRINYNTPVISPSPHLHLTLLELLYMKFDRNEIEYDSIRNFSRHNSADNASFNSFLRSMDMTEHSISMKNFVSIYCIGIIFFLVIFHSIKDKEFN